MDKDLKGVTSLLGELSTVAKLLDGLTQYSSLLENYLDISPFRIAIAKALIQIHLAESLLYDIAPNLVPEYLRPSLSPVNLTSDLGRLYSDYAEIYRSTVIGLMSHMTNDVATKFEEACEAGKGFDFAQQWSTMVEETEKAFYSGHQRL